MAIQTTDLVYVSAVTITELGVKPAREIQLTARALPYRAPEFSGTMRADVTWPAGSPNATVQFLGAQEDPTTFRGMWKDRFIGRPSRPRADGSTEIVPGVLIDSQDPMAAAAFDRIESGDASPMTVDGRAVASAAEAVILIDGMRRRGVPVRVTWSEFTREGFIQKFLWKPDRVQDIAWEITFQWTSQGDGVPQPEVVGNTELDVSDSSTKTTKNARRLGDEFSSWSADKPKGLVDDLKGFNDSIQRATNELADSVDAVENQAVDALTATKRAAGIYEFLVGEGRGLMDSTRDQELVAYSLAKQTVSSAYVTVGALLAIADGGRRLLERGREVRDGAARDRAAALKTINPTLLGVFVARADMDLRGVALLYYGTQDNWRDLLAFNDLETSRLVAGQIVFVPPARRAA